MGLHNPPVEVLLPLPPVLAMSLGSRLAPRSTIESLIASMIEALDQIDGDPDVEMNGDELDGTGGEDDFVDRSGSGPGCPISDPDICLAGEDDLDLKAYGPGYDDEDREHPLHPIVEPRCFR